MSTTIKPAKPMLDKDDLLAERGLNPGSQVVRIPAYVRDFESFREWTASAQFPEFGRISWIDGEMEIDMNAENIQFHNSVKICVMMTLGLLIDGENLGEYFGAGVRLVHLETKLSCEPDFVYCSWAAFQSKRIGYKGKSKDPKDLIELRGTPDLVAEIVSPSSVSKDKRKHRRNYFEAGIPEYWLIDARKQEIDFRILTAGSSEYSESAIDADGFMASKVFHRDFRLTRSHNQLGHWKYLLEHRSAGSPDAAAQDAPHNNG